MSLTVTVEAPLFVVDGENGNVIIWYFYNLTLNLLTKKIQMIKRLFHVNWSGVWISRNLEHVDEWNGKFGLIENASQTRCHESGVSIRGDVMNNVKYSLKTIGESVVRCLFKFPRTDLVNKPVSDVMISRLVYQFYKHLVNCFQVKICITLADRVAADHPKTPKF